MSINQTLKTQPVTPAQIQQEVKLTQRNGGQRNKIYPGVAAGHRR